MAPHSLRQGRVMMQLQMRFLQPLRGFPENSEFPQCSHYHSSFRSFCHFSKCFQSCSRSGSLGLPHRCGFYVTATTATALATRRGRGKRPRGGGYVVQQVFRQISDSLRNGLKWSEGIFQRCGMGMQIAEVTNSPNLVRRVL